MTYNLFDSKWYLLFPSDFSRMKARIVVNIFLVWNIIVCVFFSTIYFLFMFFYFWLLIFSILFIPSLFSLSLLHVTFFAIIVFLYRDFTSERCQSKYIWKKFKVKIEEKKYFCVVNNFQFFFWNFNLNNLKGFQHFIITFWKCLNPGIDK